MVPLPRLKAISSLMLKDGEVFVAAGGFEERAFKFADILTRRPGTENEAIILEYRPDNASNRFAQLRSILEAKGVSVSGVIYDRYAPEAFCNRLASRFEASDATSVCLDISGMSRLAIMIIMDVVHERRVPLRIMYSEAMEYAPSEQEFRVAQDAGQQHLPTSFIHTGVYDVLHVSRLSSLRMQNQAALLLAFDSFNEALCQALVNGMNPSDFILINGKPPRKELAWREEATKYVHSRLREEWAVGNNNREPVKSTSTLYYGETYELLTELYWEFSANHRIILAPTGSKMQTVGCYLLRAVHDDVHVEYPTVQGFFADKYSTGVRELWELDFGRLDELVENLSKAERKKYLSLPEEVVTGEIE